MTCRAGVGLADTPAACEIPVIRVWAASAGARDRRMRQAVNRAMRACIRTLLFCSAVRSALGPTRGGHVAFWSWLDIPLAILVLAAARRVPLWLDGKHPVAASGLVAMTAPDSWPIGLEPAGLAESDERLAEPDCLPAGVDPQDCLAPPLTSCPQCGLPAEIDERFWLESTDGPVDHAALSCIDGHHFRMAEPGSRSAPPMTW